MPLTSTAFRHSHIVTSSYQNLRYAPQLSQCASLTSSSCPGRLVRGSACLRPVAHPHCLQFSWHPRRCCPTPSRIRLLPPPHSRPTPCIAQTLLFLYRCRSLGPPGRRTTRTHRRRRPYIHGCRPRSPPCASTHALSPYRCASSVRACAAWFKFGWSWCRIRCQRRGWW
jgi:hypothetical protein